MLKLVFLACIQSGFNGAITESQRCREVEIRIYEQITPSACVMRAQPTLAQWQETHIGWRPQRWQCRHVPKEEL